MGVITISQEFGSGGETVARLVSEKSGFLLVNKKTIEEGLASFGYTGPEPGAGERENPAWEEHQRGEYFAALHDYIYDLAIRNDLVILGRGGQILFQDYPPSLHVRIISSFTRRVERVMKLYRLSADTASKLVKEQDLKKKEYYRRLFNVNWANLRRYHLMLSTAEMDLEDAADIITAAYRTHALPRHLEGGKVEAGPEEGEAALQAVKEKEKFMHSSEEEFARMLDFYRIRWDYEPKTFLLEWDSEGNVVEAFTPDFYLPDQDLFIELTTQKPKQAWKKNRKIRRLKELYPGVKIKIINRQGFKSLLSKHGTAET
jgi:cytidylate kinase